VCRFSTTAHLFELDAWRLATCRVSAAAPLLWPPVGIAGRLTGRRVGELTMDEQTAKSLRLFRTLIDRSNDAIEVVDPVTWRFVDSNQKAFSELGYTREEFLSLTVCDIDPTVNTEAFATAHKTLRESGALIKEGIHRKKDGSEFPVELNVSLVQLDSSYVVVVARDITVRRAAENSLRQLLGRLMNAQDVDRQGLSRSLQDGIGQYAAGLSLAIGQLRERAERGDAELQGVIEECRTLIREAGREIRAVSYYLHPPMIEELGLGFALRWLIAGYRERNGIETSLEAPAELPRFDSKIEIALFRIAEEALCNVRRHSGCAAAAIRLAIHAGELVFEISDRGKGFEAGERLLQGAWGIGILAMQARVMDLNGLFELESAVDCGVLIRVTVAVN
jgi:PAS domain S-box-containing protein